MQYQGGPPPGGYGYPPPQQPQPYQAPPPGGYGQPQAYGQQPAPYGYAQGAGYMPFQPNCPHCGSTYLTKPSFTWWGGLIGPKLFNHTVCGGCGFAYNAKTGKSNSTAIAIYLCVGVVLGILVVALRIAAG